MYFWKFSCNSWPSTQSYDEITNCPFFSETRRIILCTNVYCVQKPVKVEFLEMLSEARSIDELTSWLSVCHKFRTDRRFQEALRLSSRHAMIWFNDFVAKHNAEVIIIIIMFVYYSCSHNATAEPTSVTQHSTDTIERKPSIYRTKHNTRFGMGILSYLRYNVLLSILIMI